MWERRLYLRTLTVLLLLVCVSSSIQSEGGLLDGLGSPNGRLESRWRLTRKERSRGDSRKLTEDFAPALNFTIHMTLGLLDSNGAFNGNYFGAEDEAEDISILNNGEKLICEGCKALSAFSSYLGAPSQKSHFCAMECCKGSNGTVKTYKFELCPPRFKEYIPCLDNVAAINKLEATNRGEAWERRCPSQRSRMCCLIATPLNYRLPIRWPKSRDEVWYNNVPHTQLVADKSGQNWIKLEKDKFKFPGGGTQFPHGANGYLDHIGKMLPVIGYGSRTRVVLDVGCGVASFGAYLFARDVITLSIAPKDIHESQIQFALERGVPAMVAVFATRRLLYPSQAFDAIHCSRCRVNWTRDDGILLVEVDRLLRAGGYFIWSAQPVYKHEDDQRNIWNEMEDLAQRLCWEQVGKDGQTAIWRKPTSDACYKSRPTGTNPPFCDEGDDPDQVWYIPLKPCITLPPKGQLDGNVPEWPLRLSTPPYRLQNIVMDAGKARIQVFKSDQRYWYVIVEGYLRGLGLHREEFRNIMDMRASYGGFATALVNQKVDWWVMNVVPISGPNTLPVIYDRGLIGVSHDWCEPFDTYPRTYDLLHAVGLFTVEDKRCNIALIVLEMDRILRPGGWVLVRDSNAMVHRVEGLAKSVRWKTRILETESGPFGKDKLLSCQKPLWHN